MKSAKILFPVVALLAAGWSLEGAAAMRVGAMAETSSVATPRNGITKQDVEKRFGAPEERAPAVGEPPISRWVYKDYTVYFEADRVIHSVVHER